MADGLLDGSLTNILNFIAAAGGLGTAAMGLVDALKAFGGGPSNIGFTYIKSAVERFVPASADGAKIFGRTDILATLKANWINGTAEADQKAKAKALIHLRLTKGGAAVLADLAGVDAATLRSVAEKAMTGGQASPQEISVLGQFDAVLSAVLDEAYERADQKYRNGTKLLAVIIATLLAIAGGWIVYLNGGTACQTAGTPTGCLEFWGYLGTKQFFLALLVGTGAAPLAPVAKDLASSLQAAVTAVGAVRKLVP